MTALDQNGLRRAFGTFLTGVTVVTSLDPQDQPIGFTANSFTSVSLDPPMLLVYLSNTSRNHDAFVQAKHFAVNVLSEGQIDLSNTFARPAMDRFSGVDWRPSAKGTPLLGGASAWFDCRRHSTVAAGDHVILLGEVTDFDSTTAAGLGYVRGAYVAPATFASAVSAYPRVSVSALIERDGQILLVDDGQGAVTLPETEVRAEGATAALQKLIDASGLTAQVGFVYSVFEDVRRKRQHIAFLCHAAPGDPLQGAFVPLGSRCFDDVSDPAILSMLERFAHESELGNFGVYFGSQNSGEVRAMAKGMQG